MDSQAIFTIYIYIYWPKIVSKVLETALNILNNNHTTTEINQTLLALVPKVENP